MSIETRGAKKGTGYVQAQLWSINNHDENVLPGTVTFALASRENGPVRFPVDLNEDGRS